MIFCLSDSFPWQGGEWWSENDVRGGSNDRSGAWRHRLVLTWARVRTQVPSLTLATLNLTTN